TSGWASPAPAFVASVMNGTSVNHSARVADAAPVDPERAKAPRRAARSQHPERSDRLAFLDQLADRGIDAATRPVVELEPLHDLPAAADRPHGERRDQSLRHVVLAVRDDAGAGPVVGAVHP